MATEAHGHAWPPAMVSMAIVAEPNINCYGNRNGFWRSLFSRAREGKLSRRLGLPVDSGVASCKHSTRQPQLYAMLPANQALA